jgi:hypothetical protein
MFTETMSPTFLFDSCPIAFSFLRTSLVENELLRGVNPFENLSSSIEITSLGLRGSFCKKVQISSSFLKTCHDSTLSGICRRYRDIKVQSGRCGNSCRVGEVAKIANLSAIVLSSLFMSVMLKDNIFEIKAQMA